MAGTRIYSPQLGDDISQGMSNLGALFAPPNAQQLVAAQTIASSQASAQQKADAIAQLNGVSPVLGALFGAGDRDPVQSFGTLNQYQNSQATNPNLRALDLGNYALHGIVGNTFLGKSMDTIGPNEVRSPSPLLGGLGY